MHDDVLISTRSRAARAAWAGFGLLSVGLGGLGIVVPGLPSTVFFVIAASCFSKSSPRLERWVLNLPTIGPMVRDYRSGLGISRRTKAWAIAMVVVVISISAGLLIEATPIRIVVAVAGVVGITYLLFVVPTRERVLAARPAALRTVDVN